MATLLIEIEKGLLTDFERKDPYLFPRWFTYNVTEIQKKNWQEFVNAHPLGLGYEPDDKNGGEKPNTPPVNQTSVPTKTTPQLQPSALASSSTPTSQSADEPESTLVAAATSSTATPPNADPDVSTPSTMPPPGPPTVQPAEQESQPPSSSGSGLQTTEATLPAKCNFCGQIGNKICTGCRKVRYCSEEHQLSDWKKHKQVCKGKAKAVG
jgi:hypothetical protein